ncbi:unnamed protein product [Closterium sp. Naga37s-1]|nr:unnamed protein product [Closterium sp. Naga37s-1]
MATTLVPSSPATPSPTNFADLSEDVLLHLLSRPSYNPNRELSPEDLARLEAVCYALRRPLLLPPNRRHSVVETAARARCLRHPLLSRVPADLLRGMAAQRCGGSWLRVLRFAWAVEDAWGLRREAEEEALREEAGARNSGGLASAVYAGDYCSFQKKTNGELWVYGSGSRDGSPQFTLPPASNQPPPDQPAPVAAADQPPPDEPAQARDENQPAGQGWAAAALAAGLAAVRLGAGQAGTAAQSGSERPDAQAQQQVQPRRGGVRGRRGALRAQIVVGGSADAEGNGWNGGSGGDEGNGVSREEAEGGMRERVAQVAGGRAFTVILTKSGNVYTMGQDTNGCCGHGQEGVGKKFPQPKLVEALRGVPCQQVATGRSHVLVLSRDGTVYAFGAGGNGRLGLGDTDDRCRPTVVEGLRPEVLAAMLGGLTGGSSGDTGGNNNETGAGSSSSDPYGQYRIVSVAAGASHSLAVTAAGVVLAFGRGHSGQLGGAQGWGTWAGAAQEWGDERGEGMMGGRERVGRVQGRAGGVSRVHVGRRAGGGAAAVGTAASARAGAATAAAVAAATAAAVAAATADLSDCLVPHPIAWLVQSGVRVMKVAASVDYSAALDCLGRVSARMRCEQVLGGVKWCKQVSSTALDCLGRVSARMSEEAFSAARTPVHMWGSGYCGCLGNGSEANEVLPRVVEGLLHTRIVQVTLGKRKTLALDDQGRVLGFGWTAFGGLGVAAGRDKVFAPMPVEALEGKRVVQISTGAYHTVALCRDGSCIGFGDNEQGQLELH